MDNEMLIQAVSNIGQAVTSLTTSVKTFGTVRRQNAIVLEEELVYLRRVCRARGYGALMRQCVDEMDKTFQLIKQKDYSGPMLEMTTKLLELQYQALYKNVQDYYQNN